MSGAVNQARRRSVNNQTWDETTVTEEGWSFETQVTDAEVIDELKKPSCFGGTEAKKSVLRKLVKHRDLLFRRIGEISPHLQESAERVIPDDERSINKLTCPDVAKRMLDTRVILTEFLQMEVDSPSTTFLRSLIACQHDLTNAYNEACQNLRDKRESDIHRMILAGASAFTTWPPISSSPRTLTRPCPLRPSAAASSDVGVGVDPNEMEQVQQQQPPSPLRRVARIEKFARLPVWPVWMGVITFLVSRVLGNDAAAKLEDALGGRVCSNFFDTNDATETTTKTTSPFIMLVY